MARLIIESGAEAGLEFPVNHEPLVIGRGTGCTIQISDRRISREHVRITYQRGNYAIEDLNSRNGTFLNHQPLLGYLRLKDGDHISIGGTMLVFELEREEAEEEQRLQQLVRLDTSPIPPPRWVNTVNTDVTPALGMQNLSREKLQDPVERLRTIYALADSLREDHDLKETLWKIMEAIWAVISPSRCVILKLDCARPDSPMVPVLLKSAAPLAHEEVVISRSIVERCSREHVAVLMEDGTTDERFADTESIMDNHIRSAICAPMIAGGKCLGVIYADLLTFPVSEAPSFTRDDLDIISGIALQAALALQNITYHDELLRHQKLEKELEIARTIQERLLPASLPDVNGYQFAALCTPARLVGGDYYDFLTMTEQRLAVMIADASGKGIPAAMYISTVRTVLRAQARQSPNHSAGEIMQALNVMLCHDGTPEDFATLFLLLLNPEDGTFQFCNAGHVPPLQVSATGEVQRLMGGGTLLGIEETLPYESGTGTLKPGDVLLLYTDGLSETNNLHGNMYGEDRLKETLLRCHRLPAGDIMKSVSDHVRDFREARPQDDDLTILVIKRSDESKQDAL